MYYIIVHYKKIDTNLHVKKDRIKVVVLFPAKKMTRTENEERVSAICSILFLLYIAAKIKKHEFMSS